MTREWIISEQSPTHSCSRRRSVVHKTSCMNNCLWRKSTIVINNYLFSLTSEHQNVSSFICMWCIGACLSLKEYQHIVSLYVIIKCSSVVCSFQSLFYSKKLKQGPTSMIHSSPLRASLLWAWTECAPGSKKLLHTCIITSTLDL